MLFCCAITVASFGLESVEEEAIGHPYIEALVWAILIGMLARWFWTPGTRWWPGIAFSAKQLLEVAVMLLGASMSFAALVSSGPLLIGVTVSIVPLALVSSFALSRAIGLGTRLSILIACGNSICGNSAIAAVAPVIGADPDDVALSISFTAVLGVLMVLGLPLLIPLLQLSATQYGILAGLTVYAVPQVLAATVPAGLVSTQLGTLVKLTRVLTLGPVVLFFSLFASKRLKDTACSSDRLRLFKFVPWFILGFLGLATLRSLELVPYQLDHSIKTVTTVLTVISMAALGAGVNVRDLVKVGGRVTAAVTLSLLLLLAASIGSVHLFK